MAKQYISNKDETLRLFKSDFLEFFSRVHFTVPLFIFIPVIGYCLYGSIFEQHFSALTIAGWSLFGLVIWTFTEYTLHRFVFHFHPHGTFLQKVHFLVHGVHHDYPMDSKRLVMPPVLSIPLAAGFFFLFQWLFEANGYPFFVGFLTGYLFYDMTHYAIHHFNMHSKFWLAIKNHHSKHHFQDASKGYGVSSPIWDYIWQTQFASKKPIE